MHSTPNAHPVVHRPAVLTPWPRHPGGGAGLPDEASRQVDSPGWRVPAVICDRVVVERAESADAVERAARLIGRRYAWRGYGEVSLEQPRGGRCTLAARIGTTLVGTLSVSWDRVDTAGHAPLGCDGLFAEEVAALRASGKRLCEFGRLAVDLQRSGITGQVDAPQSPGAASSGRAKPSQAVLTALFHAAYAIGRLEGGSDVLVVEVNPRHVSHYQRQYGAQVVAGPRHHPQVGAPAVLLQMSMERLGALARRAERQGLVPPAARYATATFEPPEGDIRVSGLGTGEIGVAGNGFSAAAAATRAQSAPESRS